MKLSPLIVTLVLTGGLGALAQSNNQVPGPADYTSFTRFITDRNIFDPNRQPHYSSTPRTRTRTRVAPSTPAFTFVGTISYEKGLFAFFSGNHADLKKVVPLAETFAGYTITEISHGRVTLTATNQTAPLTLQVGDGMRQEGGKWVLTTLGESSAAGSSSEPASTGDDENAATSATSSPASAGQPNEILKRLMQKREQENK